VLATGSAPKMLPGLQVGPRVITSDQALRLDRIPTSAIVIGAGAVGLEFASMYRSFGAQVTVIGKRSGWRRWRMTQSRKRWLERSASAGSTPPSAPRSRRSWMRGRAPR
jgi:dihydrolipoamide dehydrogenase